MVRCQLHYLSTSQRRARVLSTCEYHDSCRCENLYVCPHWGKHCPIDAATVDAIYPQIDEFRRIVAEYDASGNFTNLWTRRILLRKEENE